MSNTIEYKGYVSSIEYSQEDKLFFGKLEMIDDLVTFEADNAHDLEENFQDTVNDYLKTCKELGREPKKAYKGIFNVRVDPEVHKNLHLVALKLGMSLNSLVSRSFKHELEHYDNLIAKA